VRPQVGQQAAHEPRVVGFAEDFFFVERHIQLPGLQRKTRPTTRTYADYHVTKSPGLT
jgi:hypothetical protein